MNSEKRKLLLGLSGASAVALLPERWVTPLIKHMVLPAHASTSATVCSGFTTDSVSLPTELNVNDSDVAGPIVVSRTGNTFADSQIEMISLPSINQDNVEQTTSFSGTIDLVLNQVRGDIIIIQRCEGQLICEQITSYTVDLVGSAMPNGVGRYEGLLTGTLRCCQDFF